LSVAHLFFQGLQNLLDRIERMRALGPVFIDITWCALPLLSSPFKL
jgi:5,10-methylenetetrahydrofolate reductase